MTNECTYDNSNNSLYIRYINHDSRYIIHIIDELENNIISNVIIDLRNVKENITGLDCILERLKLNSNVISFVNNQTSNELITKTREISNKIINNDDLSEKYQESLKEDIIGTIISLTNNNIEKLQTYSDENYYSEILKSYIDLILNSYSKYLDEKKLTIFKQIIKNGNLLNYQNIKDSPRKYNESTLLQKLFNTFINSNIFKEYPDLNDALIDICIIEFLKSNDNIFPEYIPKNSKYIAFLREKLESIGEKDYILNLIFNGNFEQFINSTEKSPEEFINEYKEVEKEEDIYQQQIQLIVSLSPKYSKDLKDIIMKLSSRVNSKKEALSIIKESIPQIIPEITIESIESITKSSYTK